MPLQKKSFSTILISSAAKKIPLYYAVQRAAQKINPFATVIAGDMSDNSLSKYICDNFWHMPPTNDQFLSSIVNGCKKRGISAIIPTRDGELIFWATHKVLLEKEGIAVLVAPRDAIALCMDKLAFAVFGRQHGHPCIEAAEKIADLPESYERFVVKERFGAGSRALGLNLSQEEAKNHARGLSCPIFQPYIVGQEFSADAWLDSNARLKGIILRNRDLVVSGESQVTTTFRNSAFELILKKFLEQIGITGHAVLQAIATEQGELHIIECNARFGGASTTALAAGLDSFYWSLLEIYGADMADYNFCRIAGEVKQIRIPSDIHLFL